MKRPPFEEALNQLSVRVAIEAAFWLEENMPLAWDDDLKSAW